MRSLLSVLVLVLAGFSAAPLFSPDFYTKVREVLPEDLSETISEGIRNFASDSDLGLIWTGLDEFNGKTVYAALETESTPVERNWAV